MKIENKINQKLEIKRLPNTFIYSFPLSFLQTTAQTLKDKLVNKFQ